MTTVEDTIYRPEQPTPSGGDELFFMDPNDLSEQIRGEFIGLCADVSEKIIEVVDIYEADKHAFENQHGEGNYPRSVAFDLARFDRTVRSERKLDAGLRKFFAATSEDSQVVVYPYVKDIPEHSAFQTLVDINIPEKGYAISIVRVLEDLEFDSAGSIIPNVSAYKMILEPSKTN